MKSDPYIIIYFVNKNIRPILTIPIMVMAYSAKTSIISFCRDYTALLKKVSGIVGKATIGDFLGTLKEEHPWDLILNVYTRVSYRLSSQGLSPVKPTRAPQE